MSIKVITGPAEEPITLADAKLHLRIDGAAEDAYVTSLLKAARQTVEIETSRVLVSQTLVQTFDGYTPGKPLTLLRAPVASIVSVQHVGGDGATVTLDAERYLAALGEPALLHPAYGVSWPIARGQPGAVSVTYVAGYGNAAAVPELAKAAIRLLLGHWYENREAVIVGTIASELPRGASSIIGLLKWGLYL